MAAVVSAGALWPAHASYTVAVLLQGYELSCAAVIAAAACVPAAGTTRGPPLAEKAGCWFLGLAHDC